VDSAQALDAGAGTITRHRQRASSPSILNHIKNFYFQYFSTSSMNPLVSNVSYALYAASPLPMLGVGADVLRLESFRWGRLSLEKKWTDWKLRSGDGEGEVTVTAKVADTSRIDYLSCMIVSC
jgi:hypothetical protein